MFIGKKRKNCLFFHSSETPEDTVRFSHVYVVVMSVFLRCPMGVY